MRLQQHDGICAAHRVYPKAGHSSARLEAVRTVTASGPRIGDEMGGTKKEVHLQWISKGGRWNNGDVSQSTCQHGLWLGLWQWTWSGVQPSDATSRWIVSLYKCRGVLWWDAGRAQTTSVLEVHLSHLASRVLPWRFAMPNVSKNNKVACQRSSGLLSSLVASKVRVTWLPSPDQIFAS